MFKLLVFLCAGLFLTLLIGGRDAGQARFGLQGAYDIAALKDAPAAPEAQPVVPVLPIVTEAPAVVRPAPTPAPAAQTARVTQAAFALATDERSAQQTGLTLSLPMVTGATAEPTGAAPIAREAAPLRISRILGSTVNVREGPSAKSAVVDRLARDEMVTVISTEASGWSMVRVEGDGIEGYVASRYLSGPIDDSALFPSE